MTNPDPTPDPTPEPAAEPKLDPVDFLRQGLDAEQDAQPSAVEQSLRDAGVNVTRHPKPGASEAPQEIAEAQGDAEVAAADEGALDALADAMDGRDTIDPRVSDRQALAARLVAEKGLPESVAQGMVNGAKKREIEAWLSTPAPVRSDQPLSGQAPVDPPLPATQPVDPWSPEAATPVSQQPIPGHAGLSTEDARIQALEARMLQLQAAQFEEARVARKEAFVRAGEELRGTFPRIMTDDGRLHRDVAEAARVLRQSPVYQGADEPSLLRAAAAAVFSTAPGTSQPTGPNPQIPYADATGAQGRVLTREELGDAIVSIRQRYGAGDLPPEKQALAQQHIDRLLASQQRLRR